VERTQASKTEAPETLRAAAEPVALSAAATQWMAELPQHVRPNQTAARFPRILDKLAGCWPTQSRCRAYFDELLLDQRGDRKGFPERIALELAALKNHYNSVVFPTHQTVWDEIIGRARG
jgi:hypothetical protein